MKRRVQRRLSRMFSRITNPAFDRRVGVELIDPDALLNRLSLQASLTRRAIFPRAVPALKSRAKFN